MKTEYLLSCHKDGFTYWTLSLSNAYYIGGITERITKVLISRYEKRVSYTKRKSHYMTNWGKNRVKIVNIYVSYKVACKVLDYLGKIKSLTK